jgi:STIP1 family protein 1
LEKRLLQHREAKKPIHTRRILKNPREPTFFTNRALTRTKLGKWEGVEQDARIAIDLYGQKSASSLKSRWYLAQALLGLQRPHEAYDVAIDAYRASLAAKSPQSENLSKAILRAKQAIWAAKESTRLYQMDNTLAKVESLIEADLQRALADVQGQLDRGEIGETGLQEDQKALRDEAEKSIKNVREAFRISSNGEVQERVSCTTLLCIDPVTDFDGSRSFRTTSSTESPLKSCMTRSSYPPERVLTVSGSQSTLNNQALTRSREPP